MQLKKAEKLCFLWVIPDLMTKNLDKEGLRSIAEDYDLFYIDLWGVVHNGVNLYNEAINALNEISKKNKEYVLLTNAPRPNKTVKIFLKKLGMEDVILEKVFTSGEAALKYLRKKQQKIQFRIYRKSSRKKKTPEAPQIS